MKLKIQMILSAIFTFLGIIGNIYCLVNSDESLLPFIFLALYFFTILYLVYDYKTPHGNLLKIALMVFGFVVMVTFTLDDYSLITRIGLGAAAVIIYYIAGRLNRIEKNSFLIIIVFVCLFIAGTDYFRNSGAFNGNIVKSLELYNHLIIWSVLTISYFARFKAHIEAGKEE